MNLHPSKNSLCRSLLLTGLIISLLITASSQTREKTQLPQRATTTVAPQSPADKKPQATTGSVQTPAQQPQPALPDLELSASPNPVQVGDVVTLTVRLKPSVVKGQENRSILVVPRVEYRYSFGDGPPSDWTSSSQMTHKYEAPRIYRAAAQVRLAIAGANPGPGPVSAVLITVAPSPVVISPSPAISPGSASSPVASPDASASPGASPTDSPSPSPSASPSESPLDSPSPPTGNVAGQTSPVFGPTIDRQRPPEPARQIPWKILAIVLLALLLIGYRIAKWIYAPRPTFSPQLDTSPRTKMNCTGPEPSLINFEMVLNTNMSEGRYQFHTDESQLISYLRREQ